MKRLVYFLFILVAIVGAVSLALVELRIVSGRSKSSAKGGMAFATHRVTRAEYIANLKRTMRPDDPELQRRIRAVEKSPAWD